MIKKLYQVLNQSNKNVQPETNSSFYKFTIGYGNNYQAVLHAIKLRSWWHVRKREKFIGNVIKQDEDTEDEDPKPGSHFIWTQWKKNELIDQLKYRKLNPPKLIYNHLDDNFYLADKKALFETMSHYYKSIGYDPF